MAKYFGAELAKRIEQRKHDLIESMEERNKHIAEGWTDYDDCFMSIRSESRAISECNNNIIMLNSAISASALAPHLAAISAIESDTDKKGNVINGSKKAKIIKYVMAQKLTTQQKLLLILALGYTIKDGDIKGISATKAKSTVARYITNLKISQAEKIALAEKCGMTVKNGRIYAR